jgi:hypothetical protein
MRQLQCKFVVRQQTCSRSSAFQADRRGLRSHFFPFGKGDYRGVVQANEDPPAPKNARSFLKASIPWERGTNVEPEFCTPITPLSPKAAWDRWFKATGHACQIPCLEGRKPKASGWVFMTKDPPRRCATAVAARHPSREGIFRRPAIHVQNSGSG